MERKNTIGNSLSHSHCQQSCKKHQANSHKTYKETWHKPMQLFFLFIFLLGCPVLLYLVLLFGYCILEPLLFSEVKCWRNGSGEERRWESWEKWRGGETGLIYERRIYFKKIAFASSASKQVPSIFKGILQSSATSCEKDNCQDARSEQHRMKKNMIQIVYTEGFLMGKNY